MQMVVPYVGKLHARDITETLTGYHSQEHGILYVVLCAFSCSENYTPLLNVKPLALHPVYRFSGGQRRVVTWFDFTGMLSLFVDIDQHHTNYLSHAALSALFVLFNNGSDIFCSDRL